MLSTFHTLYRLLTPQQARRFWQLIGLVLVTGLAEFAGVALILPFMALVADPGAIADGGLAVRIGAALGVTSTLGLLTLIGAGVFCVMIGSILCRGTTIYFVTRFGRALAVSLGVARLRYYLSQPYEWFLAQHSADLSKSVLQEVNEVVVQSVQPALRLIANAFVILVLTAFLLFLDPIGAIAMAVIFGLSFGAIDFGIAGRLHSMGADRRVANRQRYQAAGEALGGIKEVKMLGLEQTYLGRFLDPSRRLARYQARLALVGELPRLGLEGLLFGGMLLFTLWLLYSRDGAMAEVLPILGAFAFAGLRLMPTAQILFKDLSLLRYGRAPLEALAEDLRSAAQTSPDPGGRAVDRLPLVREIRLEDVRYRYPGAAEDAVSDIDLTIPAGATVGFVGTTGAGKSTVSDILLGLISPSSGRMLVDGTQIGPGNRRRWQRNIGFVPQVIHLVDDTIASNIARGEGPDEIDMEAVRAAARMAAADGFVEALPEGYLTRIGEAGVRLSGGERQRIGIARALYRDPDVIVLDEATSALDTVTERAVMDAVRGLHGRKTLILVSHRLGTLAGCDEIFVMQHGRIAARGDFRTLEAGDSSFQALVRAAE